MGVESENLLVLKILKEKVTQKQKEKSSYDNESSNNKKQIINHQR